MSKSRSLISRLFGRRPQMASPEDPTTSLANPASWLIEWMGGGASDAGISVNKMTALQASAVFRCVSLIAGTIANLPLGIYREIPGGGEPAPGHYLNDLLGREPNDMISSFTWREMMMAHLLMQGNHYSVIQWNGAGRAVALYPVQPEYVDVKRVGGRLRYTVSLQSGGQEVLDQADVLHIPGLGYDGIKGISVISAVLKNPVGLSLSLDKTMGRTSQNSLRPSAVFTGPKMDDAAVARLRAVIKSQQAGAENAGEPLFLPPNMELKNWQITPQDAELLASRKFQVDDIGRIFGVPSHMIGQTEKASSWGSGIEQMTIGFVNFSLLSWLGRITHEIDRKLLASSEYRSIFTLDALLRADSTARGAFIAQMIQNGIYTPNDGRRLEHLTPVAEGNHLFIASNLQPMKYAIENSGAAAGNGGGKPPAQPAKPAEPQPQED